MSFTIAARPTLVRDIQAMLPQASLEAWWQRDLVLCPTGIYAVWTLRSIYPEGWRRKWQVVLREDGQLCLMYHKQQLAASVVIRVEHPVQQRSFGVGLGPFWRFLPRRMLQQIQYRLLEIIDPVYAAYSFPIAAFRVRSGRSVL
jgi:hypothetical protein